MTSNTLSIAQRAPNVQARLKTLVNNDLKTICKAYQLPISGVKHTLQNRVLQLLNTAVDTQDIARFEDLAIRANNRGSRPPAPGPVYHGQPTPYMPVPTSSERGMKLNFYKSPFYEKVQTIVQARDLPAMPQARHTVKCDVTLDNDQALRMINNPDQYRVMLYCAQTDSYNPPTLHVAFPPQIEVRLNDDEVKSNFKGLKNKPGSTKPADLTKLLRSRANYANKLSITYALTQKKFVVTVVLVRYNSAETLVKRIKSGNVFSKDHVLADLRRVNADPDIAATSSKMSLKDPISTLRISTPVRSTFCTHNQCFDASFYMQLQEQAPTWSCPICSKSITFESLSVDRYVEDILQTVPKSIEQVTVEPDGEWRVVKEDADKSLSNAAKNAPRAAYDDDFDDDLVEIDDPDQGTIKKEPVPGNLFSTPPLSSREASVQTSTNKRSHQAVIDLTISDDEEPVRPAKRANTATRPDLPTPTSVNARPASAQPFTLDGTSSYPNALPVPNYTHPHTSFGRVSDMRPASSSVQWGSMRSPSVPFAPQLTNNNPHSGSMSRSPPTWAPQLTSNPRRGSESRSPPAWSSHQSWPRDPGGTGSASWQGRDMSENIQLPALNRPDPFGFLQNRLPPSNPSPETHDRSS